MKRQDAMLFLALSAIWGSSFMFIKLGLLGGFGPMTLVSLRLLFGFLVMFGLARRQGHDFSAYRWAVPSLIFLGFINNTVPFTLITWGELYIDSGMAAILNSTVPLFTVILAHFALADERLSWRRVIGVVVGFMGVLILFAPDLINGEGIDRTAGSIAVIVASAGYGIGSVFARKRLGDLPTAVVTTGQLGFAFLWILIPAIIFEQPLSQNPTSLAWFSAIWLGILGSGVAYLLFFMLIKSIGATPTTMVTYVIPLFAVTFGALFLSEILRWEYFIALLLIFCGVWLVNRKP